MQSTGAMVPNDVKAEKFYDGNTKANVGLNGTGILAYTIPDGYTRLDEILFDPDKDVVFSLRSQKLGGEVMSAISTKIGTAQGSIFPGLLAIPNDSIKIAFTLAEAPAYPARVSFTLVYKK